MTDLNNSLPDTDSAVRSEAGLVSYEWFGYLVDH